MKKLIAYFEPNSLNRLAQKLISPGSYFAGAIAHGQFQIVSGVTVTFDTQKQMTIKRPQGGIYIQ